MINDVLRPVLRIGDRTTPAKGLVICEQLSTICTGHSGAVGQMLALALSAPEPREFYSLRA